MTLTSHDVHVFTAYSLLGAPAVLSSHKGERQECAGSAGVARMLHLIHKGCICGVAIRCQHSWMLPIEGVSQCMGDRTYACRQQPISAVQAAPANSYRQVEKPLDCCNISAADLLLGPEQVARSKMVLQSSLVWHGWRAQALVFGI